MGTCCSICAITANSDGVVGVADQLFFVEDSDRVFEEARRVYAAFREEVDREGRFIVAYSVSSLNLKTKESAVVHRGGSTMLLSHGQL